MRRIVLTVCAASLLLGTLSCRRSAPRPAEDRHLAAGYGLLLRSPTEALREFELSSDRGELKEYALGQAREALGQLDLAKSHYDRALEKRQGFIKAETARARIDLLEGAVDPARERLTRAVAKAPAELPALLLLVLLVRSPEDRERALSALRAWPERSRSTRPPAEYFLALAALERAESAAEGPAQRAEEARRAPLHSVPAALVLARLAAQCEKPWLARALMARVLREKLGSEDAMTLAALAVELGDFELARTAARSIPLIPEVARAQLVLGQVALATGDAPSAVSYLKRGLALLPPGGTLTDAAAASNARARDEGEFLLAQALLRQKDSERAAPLLAALAARDPKNLAVQLLLVELEIDQNQAPAAVQRSVRLLADHPRQPSVLDHLVSARLAAKDTAGAIDAARKRVDLAPEDPSGLTRLVELLLSLEHKEQALAELQTRAQARPDDEASWLLWAATAERAGKPDQLRAALVRFTDQHPESDKAWLSLARLEERERHPEAASRALSAALAANPKSTAALTHLAEWSMRQQKWQAAADTYARLLELSPEDAPALNNLAYLYADRLEQPERAVTAAERAHELSGARPIIEDTLGWALLRRGRPEDRQRALGLLRHASEFLQQDDVRLHFAVALHLSGERERARELLSGFSFRASDPGHAFAQSVLARVG